MGKQCPPFLVRTWEGTHTNMSDPALGNVMGGALKLKGGGIK